jgi:aryl-alcohol dehydrogenase-like predicted oxidoreductase
LVELEVLPAARRFGLGVIPWSPLSGGMLAGILQKSHDGRRASEMVQKKLARHHDRVASYEALCREIGEEPADVALAWVLAQPAVTAPIIGPRTPEQLTGNIRSLEVQLDGATARRLDEIWPGPGGPAPEAYSW